MQQWTKEHLKGLEGKTVAITGATGGLGAQACRYILAAGGNLILLTRDQQKTDVLRAQLRQEFPGGKVEALTVEMTEISSVREVCLRLQQKPLDVLILNAGAYSIPRATCSTGYDNVYQTNFVSHYYMVRKLLPLLQQRKGKVVAVGSIAHDYSHTDPGDIDFAGRNGASKVYGNSKRYLMFGLMELLKDNPDVKFAIGHPGISFTNITAHYPPALFALIKWPMKVTFMKPLYAVRSIVEAACLDVPYLHWNGPQYFDIWGNPSVKLLKTCDEEERNFIYRTAEEIYRKIVSEE